MRGRITPALAKVLEDSPYIVKALSLVLWKFHPEVLTFSLEEIEKWAQEENVGIVVNTESGVITVSRGN